MNRYSSLLSRLATLAYEHRSESFTLKSGKQSQDYVDCRGVFVEPHPRRLAGELVSVLLEMKDIEFDQVAGVVLGGIPIADAVSDVRGIPAIYVRPDPKEHGKGRQVERTPSLTPRAVVVVEDVATTGGSLEKAIFALRKESITVVAAVVIVDRQDGAEVRLHEMHVPLYPLYTLEQVIHRSRHPKAPIVPWMP